MIMSSDFEKQDDGSYIVKLGQSAIRGRSKSKQSMSSFEKAIHDCNAKPLRCELGHPVTDLHQNLTINENNVCGQLSGVVIQDNAIIGKFNPVGPKKKIIEKLLTDTPEEYSFGMRALLSYSKDGIAHVQSIITWDIIRKDELAPYID